MVEQAILQVMACREEHASLLTTDELLWESDNADNLTGCCVFNRLLPAAAPEVETMTAQRLRLAVQRKIRVGGSVTTSLKNE